METKTQITAMATIARIGNIKIGMFPATGKHLGPYVKALIGTGAEKSTSILIETQEIKYNRGFSLNELKPIQTWIRDNQAALMLNWEKILKKENPSKIESFFHPPYLVELKVMEDLTLWSRYDDGSEKIFNFKNIEPELTGVLSVLKDPSFFKKVKVVDGNPTWPDGLDLDGNELWEISEPYVDKATGSS